MDTSVSAQKIEELQARLAEAEETLRAIYQGEVDALVVNGVNGEQIFTLQSADRPYRLLVEAMNEGAITLLQDGTILYCNGRMADMVHRPIAQVIGSQMHALFEERESKAIQSLLHTARFKERKGEFTLITSEGKTVPAQVSVRATDLDGVPAFAVLVTDISERKQAEETLRVANMELESRVAARTKELSQANELLTNQAEHLERIVEQRTARLHETIVELESWSYSIAHDMRAPLRSMQGFAKILAQDYEAQLDEVARNYLRRIGNSAERLDRFIQDLLSYSKIVRGDLPMEPLDPCKLINEIIATYPNLHAPKAEINVAGVFPRVLANQAALTQVISNLLGNAVKFVKPGTLPIVRIWAETENGCVRFWVEDNGIGIEKPSQSRIFQMFLRLHRPELYEGTGMGLAIVRKAVERMGGTVGVESEPEKGSRFWVRLKACDVV